MFNINNRPTAVNRQVYRIIPANVNAILIPGILLGFVKIWR